VSIEDYIFDIRTALEGTPEFSDFQKLENIIPGSYLLETAVDSTVSKD
jgi:hypothetical protein